LSQKGQYEIRKRLAKLLGAGEEKTWEGLVGDASGTIKVEGHGDLRYVRPVGCNLPVVVNKGAAPDLKGLHVKVGRWFKRDRQRIMGVAEGGGSTIGVEHHAPTHRWRAGDSVFIETVQILDALVWASGGMAITINAGWVIVNGQAVHLDGSTMDITENIPVSGAAYSLVRVDADGVIDVQDGTPVDSYADLSWDDVPVLEAGYALLAIVRLYEGQTELSTDYDWPDVIDARFSTMGLGSVTGHTHVEADITDLDHDAVKLQGRILADDAPSVNDVVYWDGSEWKPGPQSSGAGLGDLYSICQGRLTLASGIPVTVEDVTAADTVYFTPDGGTLIGLFDGADWNIHVLTEISLDISGEDEDTNLDIFIYDDSGTLTLERIVWTNNTTRATALAKQNEVYVKDGDATRRYLGTIRITDIAGECEDSLLKMYVWNYANRTLRTMRVSNTTGHTNATAIWISWNADDAVRVQFVIGLVEERINLRLWGDLMPGTDARRALVSVGYDVTNNYLGTLNSIIEVGCAQRMRIATSMSHLPDIGYHYYQITENAASAASVTFNAAELEANIYG